MARSCECSHPTTRHGSDRACYECPCQAFVEQPRYVRYETLLRCGRAVKVRGRDVIYQYAGEDPQKRFVTFGSRGIARRVAGDLLADLRRATTDTQYNRIIDDFRRVVRESQRIEAGEQTAGLVETPCPECGTVLHLPEAFADRAHDLCPKCNAVATDAGPAPTEAAKEAASDANAE